MTTRQITATVTEPIRISPPGERNWFPRLFVLPDGRLLQFDVFIDDATEAIAKEHGALGRISDPFGRDWREISMSRHYGFPVVLKSGVIRAFSYIIWRHSDGVRQTAAVADFDPVTLTWRDQPDAVITLPLRAVERPDSVVGVSFDRSILCESDGALLATMYGTFEGDSAYRVIMVRSDDDGATWSFVSTVAYDPSAGSDGYCEPVMARVADGSLLCVMRVGDRQPVRQSRSLDDGRTWSEPISLGVPSVDPDLCLMRNGVLAVSTGRPAIHVLFSPDGSGRDWSVPLTVYAGPRANERERENSTCYTGLRETADGRLVLVYDTNAAGSPWTAADNQINAVFIDVTVD